MSCEQILENPELAPQVVVLEVVGERDAIDLDRPPVCGGGVLRRNSFKCSRMWLDSLLSLSIALR